MTFILDITKVKHRSCKDNFI